MTRDNLGRYTTKTKYIFNKVGRTLVLLMANPYFVCVLLGATIVAGIIAFDQRYQLQSPIIVRLPYHTRPLELINSVDDFEVILSPTKEQVYIDCEEMTIDQKICSKWGASECRTALAVQRAENGTRQLDRMHKNTNGTIDLGLYQINSIHWNKDYCGGVADIVTADGNIDCAYNIWDRADGVIGNGKGSWTPWSAYNNGSYLAKL